MGLIFNGNGDVIKAVDGSLTVEGLDLGGGTNINAGIGTFSGNLNVGGVLTYEDVKNVDSVGIITARSVVSIADSIVHTGDTNTAIRFPTADTFTVETAGSERLRITSAGNVGIGTNTSNNILRIFYTDATVWPFDSTVSGAPTYTPYSNEVVLQNHVRDTEGSFAGIFFRAGSDDTGNRHGTARIAAVETGDYKADLVFGTRNTSFAERLRITSAGNVGINTDSPTSTLHVHEGDIRIQNNAGGTDGLYIRNATSTFAWTGEHENSTIPNGAIGMMITNNDVATNKSVALLEFRTYRNSATSNPGGVLIGAVDIGDGTTHSSDCIFALKDGSATVKERMRITHNGNVGINSSSPGNLLEIHPTGNNKGITLKDEGEIYPALTFDVNRSGTDQFLGLLIGKWNGTAVAHIIFETGDDTTNKDDGVISFRTASAGSPAERLRIDSSGNVGVNNNNPAAYGKFVVNGTGNVISINASSGAGSLSFFENGTGRFYLKTLNGSDGLAFVDADGSSERLRIASDGKIGISETSPQALLHLNDGANSTIMFGNTTHGYKIRANVTGSHDYGLLIEDEDGVDLYRAVASTGSTNANTHTFFTAGSQRLQIDSVGRLLVNATSAMTTGSSDGRDTIQATHTAGAQLLLARNDTSTSVSNRLGEIAALGNDSNGAGYKVGASIRFEVSSTWGSGGADYPTAICFKTCTDGSDTLTERIRVNHDGNLLFTSSQIQKINDTSSLVVSGGDNSNVGGNITLYGSNSTSQNIIRFRNSASEAMRINGDGDVSINRADNTSNSSILHISSHDVTTKYNNDNQTTTTFFIDSHHSGTEALTSNRSHIGIRMDMEYSGTGTKTNTSGARCQLYGIHASIDATKDVYTSYGGYFYSNMAADDQANSTISYGVYGYGRNYSAGGSNRSSTIAGGYFLGYRGGDINAGHCYGVYARAHNINNTGDNTGDLTGVYAEAEMDKDVTVENAYAFRGYLDRDAGTITNSFILYGSHGGDTHFSNRWGVHISDCAKNYLGGNLTITGTFEKGTDNFRIPHPLVGLTTTKDLVHSVIEGPQMDLIYRGKVDLVGGTATINIDTKAGMTEGTFVTLCRDIQCFTSNETGWTAVKGSVTGNKITIIAQDNSCTDTISWMVVGERQDDNAKSSTCTDNDGNLIVEPDKRTDIIDKYQAESEKNEYNEDPNANPGAE